MFSSEPPRDRAPSAELAPLAWAPDDFFGGDAFVHAEPDAAATAGALALFPDFASDFEASVVQPLLGEARGRDPRAFTRALAEREAERMAAEAAREEEERRRHERAVTDAYAAGRATGRAEGEAAARAELAATVAACGAALAGVQEGEQRWLLNLEEHVAALAVAVARHVVERELTTEPTRVKTLAAAAVAEFPADQALVLRVNPADLAMLKEAFAAAVAGGRELRWLPDHHIVPGGCVVEGRDRIIDGRVDTALERIYRRLSRQHA